MQQTPAFNYLNSNDPLSKEAMQFLLAYKEEDVLVDYKEDFNPDGEKDWLGITIDVMAFANTYGGYIIFGIKNKTYEYTGLSEANATRLEDINQVLQKLNRFIRPEFAEIRIKRTVHEGKTFVIMHIPESKGITHIAIADASYQHLSGKEKTPIKKGMLYLRYSGHNKILDPDGMNLLIKKHMDRSRANLLENIAKVVEAPAESKVYVISHDQKAADVQKFILSDSPEAIPVKGLSFSVSPSTDSELVASCIALFNYDSEFKPPIKVLWKLYANRRSFVLTPEQLNSMVLFCILSDIPHFFWMQTIYEKTIKQILLQIVKMKESIEAKSAALRTAAFLGKRFFYRY